MHDISKATHIDVEAGVRYWEDASVNNIDEDNDNPSIFGADKGTWRVRINIDLGRIENWPEGMIANIHYKVCDDGEYWLSNAGEKRIAKWRGCYVPGEYLCHGDGGYGDYIIMKVGGDGFIADYQLPELDYEQWSVLP